MVHLLHNEGNIKRILATCSPLPRIFIYCHRNDNMRDQNNFLQISYMPHIRMRGANTMRRIVDPSGPHRQCSQPFGTLLVLSRDHPTDLHRPSHASLAGGRNSDQLLNTLRTANPCRREQRNSWLQYGIFIQNIDFKDFPPDNCTLSGPACAHNEHRSNERDIHESWTELARSSST